jgi:hypothetical protein
MRTIIPHLKSRLPRRVLLQEALNSRTKSFGIIASDIFVKIEQFTIYCSSISITDKIVIMDVSVRKFGMTNPFLIVFKRIFCNHDDTFSFRRYNDFDFFEYSKCANCEKTLRYLKGFDESIRG